MTSTPNMNLFQPAPGSLGPQWATDLNTNSDTIDSHDHSVGRGVPITPSGMNINTDFSIQSFSLLNAKSVKFVNQTSSLATSGALDVYIKNGDLFYANGGTDVQITNGNSVAGTSGSISGLVSPASCVFSGQQFSFFYDAGTYADLRCRDLTLSTNGGSTLKVTQSVSATYTLTLPESPPATSTQLVTMSTTGTLSAPASPTLGTTASVLTWQGTTESVSPTSGSVVISGGVGIAKTVRVGGSVVATGTNTCSGLTVTTNGALITGNVGIDGEISATEDISTNANFIASGYLQASLGIITDNTETYTRVLEGTITDLLLNVSHGLPSDCRVISATGIVATVDGAIGGYSMDTSNGLYGFNGLIVNATTVRGYNGNDGLALNKFYRITLIYTKTSG